MKLGSGLVTLALLASASAVPNPGPDGKYTIRSGGITAKFIPYSAAITNLFIADRNGTVRDIVLGYDNATAYMTDPIHPNYGAIPGRYANLISNATYLLDGVRYYTQRNDGNSTMHSGTNGWSYRTWNVSQVTESSITFTMRDESDSSMGMPGLVLGQVTYRLTPDNIWSINLWARAVTHRTPLMLTNHAYWNLDAFANPATDLVLNHTLSLPLSKRVIAYNAQGLPDGRLPAVPEGSVNDFWSKPKQIGANFSSPAWIGNCGPAVGCDGYDNEWPVDRDTDTTTTTSDANLQQQQPIASLWSEWSGIRWDMYSNQEGVVVFSCGPMPGTIPIKSDQGGSASNGFVQANGCVAIEAQDWMDGINHPEWGREDKQIYGPESPPFESEIVFKFSIV